MVRLSLKTRRVLRFTTMIIMIAIAMIACVVLTFGGIYWLIGLSSLIFSLGILLLLASIRQLSVEAIQRIAPKILNVRLQNIETGEVLEINPDTIAQLSELYMTNKMKLHEDVTP